MHISFCAWCHAACLLLGIPTCMFAHASSQAMVSSKGQDWHQSRVVTPFLCKTAPQTFAACTQASSNAFINRPRTYAQEACSTVRQDDSYSSSWWNNLRQCLHLNSMAAALLLLLHAVHASVVVHTAVCVRAPDLANGVQVCQASQSLCTDVGNHVLVQRCV